MKPDLRKSIESRGYWRIHFQPVVVATKLKSLGACKELIEKQAIELRGWDYPHFPRRNDSSSGLEIENDHYQGWVDWGYHSEFWRMYQSGQFIHYLALREDWFEKDSFPGIGKAPVAGECLSLIGTVYQITEFYEFLSRLMQSGIYDEGVRVSISLHNTKGRRLWLQAHDRVPLSGSYKTEAEVIKFEDTFQKADVFQNSQKIAFEKIISLFDRFGWHQPNRNMIENDQLDLLKKRI